MARDRRRQRRARIEAWVGPWLRTLREERGENLADVVGRLAGVLLTTLSRIERGETFFPSDELPKFLAAYDTTIEQFSIRAREVNRQQRAA